MEFRNLGNSGLQVSVVGLGCNNFGGRVDLDGTRAVLDAAIDEGINLFDTADVYGGRGASEELMGTALKGKRHEVVLATKFASPMGEGPMYQGGSRKWIMQAVEDSLRRLQTDYIDLYQIHSPGPEHADGRDDARARRPRHLRQGALHRPLATTPAGMTARGPLRRSATST